MARTCASGSASTIVGTGDIKFLILLVGESTVVENFSPKKPWLIGPYFNFIPLKSCNRYPELCYNKIFVLEGGFKRYYEEINESDAFEPSRKYVPELDSNHKETNEKIIKFKNKAKRRNKWVFYWNFLPDVIMTSFIHKWYEWNSWQFRTRPMPYEQSRTERRPGLRALLNDSKNDSTPIRRSKRKT